ncbi:MAG: putative lipid II flippase FtsW [Oscillospiraceae bacterium]|nr:putative lipid II flippase FtsW [Oscillospiraceae bacterium]
MTRNPRNKNNRLKRQTKTQKPVLRKTEPYGQVTTGKKSRKRNRAVELVVYRSGVDHIFMMLVIILLLLGTVMIFSASYANALQYRGDSYYFARRQFFMAALGVAAMVGASHFAKYTFLEKIAVWFFAATLLLNYITPVFGMMRWIILPVLGTFQPSELLKVAVVLLFAFYINKAGDRMRTLFWGILVPGLIIVLIAVAMFFQSHFSGLIIIAAICCFIIFIGEAPLKWLGAFAAIGAGLVAIGIFGSEYARSRVEMWRDPFLDPSGDGYQTIQSLYAIGSGGLTGVGWGQSMQKHLYLPEPQNDFIFAIICEEMGFIGALIIISLFIVLIWRGFVIAYHAPNKFSSLVVMGIIIKVAIQFLLNIAVVTNTIPNTGISLPFFSYGGTALIVLMGEMGIILSVSRYSYEEKA